jgi:hypothetical protein
MLPTIDGQHRLLAIATLLYPVLKSSLEGSAGRRPLFSAADEFFALRVSEARPGTAPSDASLVSAITELATAADSPLRRAFFARACAVIARMVVDDSEEELAAAVAAPSDWGVLFKILESATPPHDERDPLAAARVRGLRRRQEILGAEGGLVTAQQVAERLGLTRQAVDNRRKAGRLIALQIGRRGLGYPTWQFGERGVLEGLEETLAVLQVVDPWQQAWFFLTPDVRLEGRRPLDALRAGERDHVRMAAEAYGEQGGN